MKYPIVLSGESADMKGDCVYAAWFTRIQHQHQAPSITQTTSMTTSSIRILPNSKRAGWLVTVHPDDCLRLAAVTVRFLQQLAPVATKYLVSNLIPNVHAAFGS